MKKVIEIEGQTFTLDNNVGWLLEYQDQFGHDILPDIMPILGAILEFLEGAMSSGVTMKDAKDITKAIQNGAGTSSLIELAGFRMTDVIAIVWALAKTADPNIDPPRQWVRQYNPFPLDKLLPEVFGLVASGLMSSKNWNRLQTLVADLRASREPNA